MKGMGLKMDTITKRKTSFGAWNALTVTLKY